MKNNAIIQNNNKYKKVRASLTQFVQILEKSNDKSLDGIKKQIKEISDCQKVLNEDIEISIRSLYNEIGKKRQENSDYELSRESLDDNLRLLNLSKKGKNVTQTIVDKTQNDELKKAINGMKSFFQDDVVKGVEQAFKELNEVYKFNDKIIDDNIQYRESYTNLITDYIKFKEYEEALPFLNQDLMQDIGSEDSIIFPPVLPDGDFDLNIDDLDLY